MKKLRIILLVVIISLLLNSPLTTWAVNYRVRKVQVKELPYETQVIITADTGVKYSSFILSDPPRIVIDIPNATLQWKKKEIVVEKALIKKVRCGQYKDQPPTVRTVVDLTTQEVKYAITKKDNQIIVKISLFQVEKKKPKVKRRAKPLPATVTKPKAVIEPRRKEKPKEYIIGIGDLLDISVWGYDELAKEVTVRSDGKLSFPLIGDVRAGGLTPRQLDGEITKGLTLYVKKPQVTVIVKEVAAVRPEVAKRNRIFILGQVKSPGVYRLGEGGSFAEVLTLAGGVTKDASFEKVTVTTKEGKVIPINLNRLLIQGDKNEDVVLQDGDTVYIAEAKKVLILGQVKSPGAYSLPEKEIGVLGGIVGLAGSYTEDAVLKTVALLRYGPDRPQMILVNMKKILHKGEIQRDITLEPGDIIFVPTKTIASINYVIRQIMPSLRAAEWMDAWKSWPTE